MAFSFLKPAVPKPVLKGIEAFQAVQFLCDSIFPAVPKPVLKGIETIRI